MKSEQVQKPSKYSENFERIKASPEQVARAIMNSPPRKRDEWKFQNRNNSK